MEKILFVSLGCKINQYENALFSEQAEKYGFYSVESEDPEIVVINGCSVTSSAEGKSRRKIFSLRRKYPQAVIVAAGCFAQEFSDSQLQELSLDLSVPNNRKHALFDILRKYLEGKRSFQEYNTSGVYSYKGTLKKFRKRTRAFVKIEDGCKNYCTYCIIPYLRGEPVSRDFNEIQEEFESLSSCGCTEIVLTGINIGYYDSQGYTLESVLRESLKYSFSRIRISSIEVNNISDELIELIKTNPEICSHLHIPLQSGSNITLQRMHRKYSLHDFEKTLLKLRKEIPEIEITTDLILGFPGEDNENFQEALTTLEKLQFLKIHFFRYSDREGTVAEKIPEKVSEKMKKEWLKSAEDFQSEIRNRILAGYQGRIVEVLYERNIQKQGFGLTSQYIPVYFEELDKKYKGKILKVLIQETDSEKLKGTVQL